MELSFVNIGLKLTLIQNEGKFKIRGNSSAKRCFPLKRSESKDITNESNIAPGRTGSKWRATAEGS